MRLRPGLPGQCMGSAHHRSWPVVACLVLVTLLPRCSGNGALVSTHRVSDHEMMLRWLCRWTLLPDTKYGSCFHAR